jgi:adenylate kinase
MRIVFQGPPGSGKGTQSKLLCERFGMTHISTGDILREASRRGTPLGIQAQEYMDKGLYAPDDLVNDIVADRFRQGDRPLDFLMDGYPRTRNQAEAFHRVLSEHQLSLHAVLFLEVPDEEIVRRISGRRVCPKDQTPYHVTFNPPKKQAGVCDLCGTPLVQRSDDAEATVRSRQRQYHGTVQGVVDFYKQKNLLREVNGLGTIQEVFASCLAALPRETL